LSRFRTPLNAIEDPTGFDPPIYPQAQIDPVDFDMLDQADAGEGVLSGCLVSASSPEALTVDVASGQVVLDGVIYSVSATPDLAIVTPNLTQPRFDLVCADDSTTPFIVQGLPADVSPLFPSAASVMGSSVVLASIYVPAGLDAITEDHLTDKRASVIEPLANNSDWQRVVATANLTRSNTATLTADNDLHFPMASNGKYAVRGHVVITGLAASDVKVGFLGPSSPAATYWYMHATVVRSNGLSPQSASSYFWTAVDGGSGTPLSATITGEYSIEFQGIVHNSTDTSPDFSFAWAQNTAVAENTVRRAGSYIEWLAL